MTVRLPSHSPALIIVKEVLLPYSIAVLWDNLPLDIRQSPCLDEFKFKLKNYDLDTVVLCKFYFAFIDGVLLIHMHFFISFIVVVISDLFFAVEKAKLSSNTLRRRSTTVPLEIYPFIIN